MMNQILPILLMNAILIIIAVLLIIAERFLVTYGKCKITITYGDEKKEFVVQGGNYLLTELTNNKINVPSACGAKAACGYCKIKVLNGGGQLLPTEEVFMSRQERLDDIRLACQVKIRNDIEVYMPDFLSTIRNIVKNRSYNPDLKWRFSLLSAMNAVAQDDDEIMINSRIPPGEKTKIDQMILGHKDEKDSSALILILQSVNAAYGFFPENVLWYISKRLNVPLGIVFRVATFYNAFSLKPKGKNIIRVCLGTSCYVKGGAKILSALEDKLKIKVGEATDDLEFSLETVNCIGCCGQSPVISVNDEIHGYFKTEMIGGVLNDCLKGVYYDKIKA